MIIELDQKQEHLFEDLKSNKPINEVAAKIDWGISANTYMLLGLTYVQHKGEPIAKKILDFLCECNFHSSHDALKAERGNDLYNFLKAY